MKKFVVILCAVLLLMSSSVFAKKGSIKVNLPKGSVYDGFGIGFIAGQPSGLSIKKYMSRESALQFDVAWGWYGYSALHISLDYLVHNYDIITVDSGDIGLYVGIGAFGTPLSGFSNVGVRVPLGVCYNFESNPLDIFLEMVPGIQILPGLNSSWQGGIGLRYYI